MRRTLTRRAIPLLALAAVALLVSACGGLPLEVPLQDVTVDLGAITNTQGTVLYPASPSAFQKSGLHVASATIDGDVSASGLSGDTTFTFYGRASDPSQDSNCQQVTNLSASYYACPASQETAISGAVTLPVSGAAKPVHLTGNVLAEGADRGRLWVGASVQGGVSTNATLHFTKLVASIVLF